MPSGSRPWTGRRIPSAGSSPSRFRPTPCRSPRSPGCRRMPCRSRSACPARAEDRLIVDVSVGSRQHRARRSRPHGSRRRCRDRPGRRPAPRLPTRRRALPRGAEPRQRARAGPFGLAVPESDLTMAGTIGRCPARPARSLGQRLPSETLRRGDRPRLGAFDPEASATAAMTGRPGTSCPRSGSMTRTRRRWGPCAISSPAAPFPAEFVTEVEADGRRAAAVRRRRVRDAPRRAGTRVRHDLPPGHRSRWQHRRTSRLAHVVRTADPPDRIASPIRSPLVAARGPRAWTAPARTPRPRSSCRSAPSRPRLRGDGRAPPEVQRAVATERWTGSWYTDLPHRGPRAAARSTRPSRPSWGRSSSGSGWPGTTSRSTAALRPARRRARGLRSSPTTTASDVARAVLAALGRGTLTGRPARFFHPDASPSAQPVTLSASSPPPRRSRASTSSSRSRSAARRRPLRRRSAARSRSAGWRSPAWTTIRASSSAATIELEMEGGR